MSERRVWIAWVRNDIVGFIARVFGIRGFHGDERPSAPFMGRCSVGRRLHRRLGL